MREPLERGYARALLNEICAFVHTLPSRDENIFHMCIIEEREWTEASLKYGIGVSRVGAILRRCQKRINEHVG